MLQILEREEYSALLEDLLLAKEAEIKYDTRGIEGTISYNDDQNRRLVSKS